MDFYCLFKLWYVYRLNLEKEWEKILKIIYHVFLKYLEYSFQCPLCASQCSRCWEYSIIESGHRSSSVELTI